MPTEARKHFDIKSGGRLLVAGALKKGIVITKTSVMKEVAMKIYRVMGGIHKEEKSEKEE